MQNKSHRNTVAISVNMDYHCIKISVICSHCSHCNIGIAVLTDDVINIVVPVVKLETIVIVTPLVVLVVMEELAKSA